MFQVTRRYTEMKWPMNWLITVQIITKSARDNGSSGLKEDDAVFSFNIIFNIILGLNWALFRFNLTKK